MDIVNLWNERSVTSVIEGMLVLGRLKCNIFKLGRPIKSENES